MQTPEAPCHLNNTEASAWQAGWDAGNEYSSQAIVEISKTVAELRGIIKEAHRQLCIAYDHNEQVFVHSARAMLGDVDK